ncbi:MAG: DNA cytosine methyltransferase [Pseudomonadales bacterium]
MNGYRMQPQPDFNFGELVIDNFAGGGGASTGIENAIGRSVDIAINHDIDAIRMHETNHPHTKHYCESVWDVDPEKVTNGQPVGFMWLSPDCKHFSKAKGSKPVNKNIRGLAWVALPWASKAKPRVFMLENVEEFKTWGPLKGNMPCPDNKGKTFEGFILALTTGLSPKHPSWQEAICATGIQYNIKEKLKLYRGFGYQVEDKVLSACDYGAATTRKRLFLIGRCDGQPIVWPKPTHGHPDSEAVLSGKLKPWRTAAEIIDWSIPCPSIFTRKKPLVEKTMQRIAKGLGKFVINNANPFLIRYYGQKREGEFRGKQLSDPLPTQTTENRFALVNPVIAPFITEHANASNQRNMPADSPLRTICAQVKGGHFAIVAPIIDRQFSNSRCNSVEKPLGTVMADGNGKSALCAAFLAKHYGGNYNGSGISITRPVDTITTTDHHALVSAFLLKYYGTSTAQSCEAPVDTITTVERFALVTVQGELYRIIDIGMRMLQPHELFAAQGFPLNYIINRDHTGKIFTKASQVARCGNSVCPDLAEALVAANYSIQQEYRISA